MSGIGMTSRLHRFAQRAFDADTYERIVVPALQDVEHECAGAAGQPMKRRGLTCLRAYWGVAKAMALCGIGDVAQNRDGIARTVATRTGLLAVVVACLLMLPSVQWMISFGAKFGTASALVAGALLVPSELVLALPAAFFLALALFRSRPGVAPTRVLSTALAGSIVSAFVAFVAAMFLVPTSNQAYREYVFAAFRSELPNAPSTPLRQGLTEMRLPELNEHIHSAPSRRQAELARAHRQERVAFVGAVFVLGLLGLGLVGRWRSVVITTTAAIAVLGLFGASFSLGAGVDRYGYPPAYGIWTANGAFLVLALRLIRTRPAETIETQS
jgi:hypothetical protein